MWQQKNKFKSFFLGLFFLFVFFLNILNVNAQTTDPCESEDDPYGYACMSQSSLGDKDPRLIAVAIINFSLGLIGTVCVVLIVYAGYLWMTAGGNDDQIGKAKNILIAAIIGALIVFSAYSITRFVSKSIWNSTQYYGGGLDVGITGGGDININND